MSKPDPNTAKTTTTFRDTEGRVWDLALNVTAVKRVRAMAGVNLLDAMSTTVVSDLADDVIRLVDVAYAICEPQCRAAGVSDEAFGAALGGDSLEQLARAFMEAVAGFFARPDQRKVIRAMAEKIDLTMAAAERTALERLDKLDPEELVRDALAQAEQRSNASSGGPPAHAGSIPALSRSASCARCSTATSAAHGLEPPPSRA